MTNDGAGPAAGGGGTTFAFVLGTGRCGSTLVHEVLARHPDTGFVCNLEDRVPGLRVPTRLSGSLYRALPPGAATKGRIRFAPSEAYRALDREVSPALSTPMRDLTASDLTPWLAERLRRFFERRADGVPLFLHKFTGWPRAGLIRQALPRSRFVHVVRDGRAVASSWLQMPWWQGYRGPSQWQFGPLPEPYQREWEESGRSFVVLAGVGWKTLIDAHERARDALPDHCWIDVRYEEVVGAPRAAFARLLEFLGLDWTPAFERQFSRYAFRPERALAYRRDLGDEALGLLERSLAAHLARYGYEEHAPEA
jgi:hypothetical protein